MQLPSQWLINMVKVLLFGLQQCFKSFVMLSVEGSSEKRPFKLLCCNTFRSAKSRKYISYEGHPFLWNLQNWIEVLKMQKKKKIRNVFFFWENCIWIGSAKLSLLSRYCLSSAVNALRNSLTILYITKRDFFQRNYLHSD